MQRPYLVAAEAYLEAGFNPLPAHGKTLLVTGFSGYAGRNVVASDIDRWSQEHPYANILLRLPEDVIGLDVDAYKGNLVDLAELQDQLGQLPKTWNADSRGGAGGKLLYRVPVRNAKWKSEVNGITTIQRSHRYVLAPPSFNPDSGSVVRWYDHLNGSEVVGEIPYASGLPMLPNRWVAHLLHTEVAPVRMFRSSASPAELFEHFNQGPPCEHMQRLQTQCADILRKAHQTGLHDAGLHVIGKVFNAATNGHAGAETVINTLGEIFTAAPRNRDLATEWLVEVEYVAYRVNLDELETLDLCTVNFILPTKPKKGLNDEDQKVAQLRSAGFSLSQALQIVRGNTCSRMTVSF